ncbi:MAG: acetate CoA-transferase YdiF [Lawsonibacter sp.]|nr:acetate CoA-transferase YdiF [Lawsonibacter sp.]
MNEYGLKKKARGPARKNRRVPVMTAAEAIKLVKDRDVVAMCGCGGGINEASELINALADRYRETRSPQDLTFYHSTGLGDRADRGMSPLAQPGLVKRDIGGHWGQSPRLCEMAERNEIEAYNFPMGAMAQLMRAAAAGAPGILTHVGLGTFLDPRQQGGRLNEATREELIQLQVIDGKEWLFYPCIYPDVALIRGTSADTEGYITMEDEVLYTDSFATAMAAHNNGGIVIAQVERVVKAGTLPSKEVKIPGYLVDVIVEVPGQPQLYGVPTSGFVSGRYTQDFSDDCTTIPLNERKVIARRALMEVAPGYIGNVGVGICDGIGVVAKEEGVSEEFTLTVETGIVGGVSAQGIYFGASVNARAVVDMPAQFDFYDGGGLDISFLSFAEFDQDGNVNVHKFNNKIMGTGGFVDICQNSKKAIFAGTLKAGGLRERVEDGAIHIDQEGRFIKAVEKVPEITFNGREAVARGQEVIFITERAVFRLTEEGVVLTEVAPGVDLERDIVGQMAFRPIISPELKEMDGRLFREEVMDLKCTQFHLA